ncbi:hypothetical protein WN48_03496 [Eufriesea mexicana]|uniref:Uncharacterized protein n=1 Tax=Eufriesea mexicana TaxID=516756 RepID=A0A310SPD8_9HYME|nr:hypothetical protein WN48_03496 [Eufriesea mexicana]
MSHRPESRVRARYTLLQDASTSLHLHAVARKRERDRGAHSPQSTMYHHPARRAHTVHTLCLLPLNVPRCYHLGHG